MSNLVILAKNLRKSSTDAERCLWKYIRNKNFLGLKFRRQVPIGKYIVDFACFKNKINIELDGGQHNEDTAIKNDKVRTKWLESQGFKVLRFWNSDVLKNTAGVWDEIGRHCAPSPQPSPTEGRGGRLLSLDGRVARSWTRRLYRVKVSLTFINKQGGECVKKGRNYRRVLVC